MEVFQVVQALSTVGNASLPFFIILYGWRIWTVERGLHALKCEHYRLHYKEKEFIEKEG